jgi:K+-transporting ATPase ATPase C chain
MWRAIRSAVIILALLTAVTGAIYPLAVTAVARVLFPERAEGSILDEEGRRIGSALIGQPFRDPAYFWGRPSATARMPYDGAASAPSNLGPNNPALAARVAARLAALRGADPGNPARTPVDLLTASASGLDPHISPAAAYYQAGRVARARGLAERDVRVLIKRHTEGRQLGVLGEPRVNVLRLNLALDRLPARRRD